MGLDANKKSEEEKHRKHRIQYLLFSNFEVTRDPPLLPQKKSVAWQVATGILFLYQEELMSSECTFISTKAGHRQENQTTPAFSLKFV